MPNKDNKAVKIGKKMMKFFLDLKNELKKVIWPDRKKLVQSTVTVLAICLLMAVLVFVIDKVLSTTLNAVGFFPTTKSTVTTSNILSTGSPISVAPPVTSSTSSMSESSSTVASQEVSSSVVTSQESSATASSQG